METGTYVIGRSGGVWRIREKTGDTVVLEEHGGQNTKTIPANSNEIVRAVCTGEDMEELIRRVPYIRTIQAPNERIRREYYDMAMEKYDGVDWICVIKTVYIREQEHRLTPMERNYGTRARNYYHGEVSAVLGIPLDRVEAYIEKIVKEDSW